MASYCPKCHYRLALTDIKPECPVCGVNLLYYGMEQSLKEEADRAEYEHALFQPKLDRLKSGTVGSPLAIARLVMTVLPLFLTLLPLGHAALKLPFYSSDVTINIISIIKKVLTNLDLGFYTAMIGAPGAGNSFVFFLVSLVCFLLSVVFFLINVINLTMAAAPKGIARNLFASSVSFISSTVGIVCFSLFSKTIAKTLPGVFTGGISWGAYVYAASYLIVIILNIVYKKHGPEVKYTDVSHLMIPWDEREHNENQKEEKEEKEETI